MSRCVFFTTSNSVNSVTRCIRGDVPQPERRSGAVPRTAKKTPENGRHLGGRAAVTPRQRLHRGLHTAAISEKHGGLLDVSAEA